MAMGMIVMEFEPDNDLMAGAAFRLSWPGEAPAMPPVKENKKQKLAAKLKAASLKLPFKRRLKPARHRVATGPLAALTMLGRKFKSRRVPCLGWPVSLSVPGPEVEDFLPRVKMKGKPLD